VIHPIPSSEARTWAMVSHLAALAIFTNVPFGNLLGPLIVYLIKKDQDPFIAEQGKESLNFQITVTIIGVLLLLGYIASFLVTIFGTKNAWPWPLIVIPWFVLLAFFDVVYIAYAAARSYNGEHFRYPLSIRFLR
jgi:uncharacterized Tic20 family protein